MAVAAKAIPLIMIGPNPVGISGAAEPAYEGEIKNMLSINANSIEFPVISSPISLSFL